LPARSDHPVFRGEKCLSEATITLSKRKTRLPETTITLSKRKTRLPEATITPENPRRVMVHRTIVCRRHVAVVITSLFSSLSNSHVHSWRIVNGCVIPRVMPRWRSDLFCPARSQQEEYCRMILKKFIFAGRCSFGIENDE
jgi:hypothetical protein